MGKYIITNGQNLYDVALHIYGSIEGIVDLMMNNPELSFCTELMTGDELVYTDDFIIDPDVAAYYRNNNIIPANGERHVYFKKPALPVIACIDIHKNEKNTGLLISGIGKIEIDWGDNSDIQTVPLQPELQLINHIFDNTIQGFRKTKIYGNAILYQLDFTELKASSITFYKPVEVEKFSLRDANLGMKFISLMEGVYEIDLTKLKTDSLLPLVTNKRLMKLDLTGIRVDQKVLDEYLIALVLQHYGRRNCTIKLSMQPSGAYREPQRDENRKYVLTTGMEAVWVLVNEPAWNEGGYWRFIIGNNTYTAEP